MNVLFKCFKCERDKKEKGEIEKVIHSYSRNKNNSYDPYKNKLCKHFFAVKFNWKTRYGFFTLGWKVEIFNVRVVCSKCKRTIDFADQTFSSSHHDYEEYKECCDNIVIYSAHEGKTFYSNEGLRLQQRIEEQIKLMKEEEEKLKKMEEETKRMEKEERQRQEREEKKRKEIEKKLRKQNERESKELNEIRNLQEKENEKLNNQIDIDISYIEVHLNQKIVESDNVFTGITNFNAQKEINKTTNFHAAKSH